MSEPEDTEPEPVQRDSGDDATLNGQAPEWFQRLTDEHQHEHARRDQDSDDG